MSRAMILFAHGARDPAWATPFERLRQLIRDILPDATVSLAFLELIANHRPTCGPDRRTAPTGFPASLPK